MTLPDDTRIAGERTVADWMSVRQKLTGDADSETWETVFREFFEKRMKTRYFAPIRKLEGMKQNDGEGFAIVTLHCCLIEFLASTLEGKTYKYRQNGESRLHDDEYSNSGEMFVGFLTKRQPFRTMFSEAGTAEKFYANVRCGLLHEAWTKNGWRIRVCPSDAHAIDPKAKIVYRDKMQSAFDAFVSWYRGALLNDKELQKAFIRKFDSLCKE